jgi:hypothetical protein
VKRCKICGVTKPLSEFYKSAGMSDGHRSDCKACNLARKKVWYAQNRDAVIAKVKSWQRATTEVGRYNAYQRAYRRTRTQEMREGHLRRTFGITQADYEALLTRQGGGCGICGRTPGKVSLHVDHDHETGEIRGLLCVGCNNALGQLHDDPVLLYRAADYVSSDLRPSVLELELASTVRERALALALREVSA